jgi:hypothetical protein
VSVRVFRVYPVLFAGHSTDKCPACPACPLCPGSARRERVFDAGPSRRSTAAGRMSPSDAFSNETCTRGREQTMIIGLHLQAAMELNCKSNTRGYPRFLPDGALRGVMAELEAEIYASPIAAHRRRAARQNALTAPAQVEPGLVEAYAARQQDLAAPLEVAARPRARLGRGVCTPSDSEMVRLIFETLRRMPSQSETSDPRFQT